MTTRIYLLSLLSLLVAGLVVCAIAKTSEAHLDEVEAMALSHAASPATSAAEGAEQRQADEVETNAAVEGFYGAPVGRVMSWHFQHTTSYGLATIPGEDDQIVASSAGTVAIPFRGTLHMQILDRDGETITALVQGTEIETPIAGTIEARGAASLRACREALEDWFLVRIDGRGTVQGYAFQDRRTPAQRNFVRAVIASFFHTIPGTPTPTWAASESDATGTYEAAYRLLSPGELGPEIERVKRHYTEIGQEPTPPEHALSGCSRARFDTRLGWIAEVDVDESMTMDVRQLPSRVRVAVKARFARTESEWRGIELDPAQWPPFLAASGATEDLTTGAIAEEREQWRRQTADVTLDDLLAKIRALVEAGGTRSTEFYTAWELLHWKLALDPKSVAAARELLLGGGMEERTGSMLLSALGKAGSTQAQATLLAVYTETGLADAWRESATFAMFQLARPSTEVLKTVVDRVHDLRDIGQLDAASILLLGTLAPRQGANLANGHTALDKLFALEGRARDLHAKGLWLDALGNAAVPSVAPRAARYLHDDDALVRESAVAALDHSMAKGIAPALAAVAKTDPSRDVRLRAIEALGKRNSKLAITTLRELSRDSKDDGIRRAAIRAIGAR